MYIADGKEYKSKYEYYVEKGYYNPTSKVHMKKKYDKLPNDAKPIPDLPTYYATPDGQIWRKHRTVRAGVEQDYLTIICLSQVLNRNGYMTCQPYIGQKKKVRYVHRLVLKAFNGLPPEGYECHHKDSDRLNNHISNLEWITKQENLRLAGFGQMNSNGGRKKGSKNKKPSISKWSSYKNDIIKLRNEGYKPQEISNMLSIPVKAIYYIK